jgi:hypothetical protein
MSDEAALLGPVVNYNFVEGFYRKIVDRRLGDNGP